MDGPPVTIHNTPGSPTSEIVVLADYLTNPNTRGENFFTEFKVNKDAVLNAPRNHSWSNSVGKRPFTRLMKIVGPHYGL